MPIARNGYHQYTHINQVWEMKMPMMPDDNVSAGVLGRNLATVGDEEEEQISAFAG